MTFRAWLLVFVVCHPLAAQTIYFNNLSIDDGLRNGNVRAFVKDYQGFMWIGTEDGLHRYDGQSIKVYRKLDGDSTSLGSNFVLCMLEDKRHNLWIGTADGGLFVYRRAAGDPLKPIADHGFSGFGIRYWALCETLIPSFGEPS